MPRESIDSELGVTLAGSVPHGWSSCSICESSVRALNRDTWDQARNIVRELLVNSIHVSKSMTLLEIQGKLRCGPLAVPKGGSASARWNLTRPMNCRPTFAIQGFAFQSIRSHATAQLAAGGVGNLTSLLT